MVRDKREEEREGATTGSEEEGGLLLYKNVKLRQIQCRLPGDYRYCWHHDNG